MEIKYPNGIYPVVSVEISNSRLLRKAKNLTPLSLTRDYCDSIQKNKSNNRITMKSISKKKNPKLASLTRRTIVKPLISSECWVLYKLEKCKMIEGKNENLQREIASLTKIMTCLTVIYEVNHRCRSFDEVVKVSKQSADMDGTSAELKEGDQIRIFDLLYGLMLPSGNDAAVALAEYVGRMIDRENDPITSFVNRMNKYTVSLDLKQTHFTNPHGMSTSLNLSTACDIAKLGCIAMKNSIFSMIVSTKKHFCKISGENGSRKAEWTNTNILLDKGFAGVKTGTTPAAGACLCFCLKKKQKGIIGVLLGCRSSELRWVEAMRLTNYSTTANIKLPE